MQDFRKTKINVVQYPQCGHASVVQISAVVVRFSEFLRQPCNKNERYSHGGQVPVLHSRKQKSGCKLSLQLYEHLVCLAAVLHQGK